MQKKHEIITLDVREQEEFEKQDIPGTKSMPLSELSERLEELPKQATVCVACNFGGQRSHKSMEILKDHGHNVDTWRAV